MRLFSKVKGHEGPCIPVWLNENPIYRFARQGQSGFFRKVRRVLWVNFRYGPEFHGVIREGGLVVPSGA